MDVGIDLADRTEVTEDRAHLRFALYWTAYEAAYQVYEPSGNSPDKKKREAFHLQVTRWGSPELRNTLSRHRESIVKLLELRQANGCFWYRKDQPTTSAAAWEKGFQDWVRRATRRLDNLETASTLDEKRVPGRRHPDATAVEAVFGIVGYGTHQDSSRNIATVNVTAAATAIPAMAIPAVMSRQASRASS
jgi:hypothetical protein